MTYNSRSVFITVGLLVLISLIHFKVECKRDILHGYRHRGVIEFFVSNINLENVVLYFLKNRILEKHTISHIWRRGKWDGMTCTIVLLICCKVG